MRTARVTLAVEIGSVGHVRPVSSAHASASLCRGKRHCECPLPLAANPTLPNPSIIIIIYYKTLKGAQIYWHKGRASIMDAPPQAISDCSAPSDSAQPGEEAVSRELLPWHP